MTLVTAEHWTTALGSMVGFFMEKKNFIQSKEV